MPESRGRGLTFREPRDAEMVGRRIGVYRLNGDTSENVTAKVKAGEALPEGRYLLAAEVRRRIRPGPATGAT